MAEIYDLAIIGAGPAGLSAGLYAGRAKLNTIIFEKNKPGGQIATTQEVANVPGSIFGGDGIATTGPDLTARMVKQSDEFGATRVSENVESVDFSGDVKKINTNNGSYEARAVIIAGGASPRKLGVPGEKELTGKGVSYCATCDGAFFEEMEVLVVGGGYSAAEEAMFLTKLCSKVTILVREDKFSCAASVVDKVNANDKIEVKFNTEITEIKGDGIVEAATLRNRETGEEYEFTVDDDFGVFGVFVFVGFEPQTDLYKGKVELDQWGYLLTDDNMKTNVEGVYGAGDIRPKLLRQVVTAMNDGAIAATAAEKYIDDKFH
ncbi:MAG: FAD-dependent oxidoreductase [Bacilli bacterium]